MLSSILISYMLICQEYLDFNSFIWHFLKKIQTNKQKKIPIVKNEILRMHSFLLAQLKKISFVYLLLLFFKCSDVVLKLFIVTLTMRIPLLRFRLLFVLLCLEISINTYHFGDKNLRVVLGI